MFKAIKIIQQKRKTEPIIVKRDDEIIGNIDTKVTEITKHFQNTFNCENQPPLQHIVPQKLQNPFTEQEIQKAVKSLKNNKSAGCDNINAENIKYAPCLHTHIAYLLNLIAETGNYPDEIKLGLLTPIQKPGKSKGPPENLRPIILLSTLRKILAICVTNRIRDRIDEHIIPVTQTAYSSGRCTTELVFTFKVLAEKAVTSIGYNINVLMLDMSKAFDTIQRGTLLNDLKGIIGDDELHLVSLLLDKVSYSVKLEGKIGQSFPTNIGSPQGDSASALFFITYLANSLNPNKTNTITAPLHLLDHNYNLPTNDYFTIDQQYADDIGWISTGPHILDQIENTIPDLLKQRNLHINDTKTEKYHITRGGNDSWKKCKYVGSLLGTKEDINRRIGITNSSYNTLEPIFKSKKVSQSIKLRIFGALLESIFLYNSEVWGLTKTLEDKIDTFHRRLLHKILNIKWTNNNWISNNQLYDITHQTQWSKKIAHRRIRFFGHIARLDNHSPAKIALREATRPTKKPQGRPSTTLLGVLKKQLRGLGIRDFSEAIDLAQDRDNWRKLITEHVA